MHHRPYRSWLLLPILAIVLALFGVSDFLIGITADPGITVAITGLTPDELRAASPEGYRLADFMVRTQGVTLAAFGVLLAVVLWWPYRGGQPWAWKVVWILPAWAISVPLTYLAFGLAPDVPPAPPMISGPILAILATVVLVVDRRRFSGGEDIDWLSERSSRLRRWCSHRQHTPRRTARSITTSNGRRAASKRALPRWLVGRDRPGRSGRDRDSLAARGVSDPHFDGRPVSADRLTARPLGPPTSRTPRRSRGCSASRGLALQQHLEALGPRPKISFDDPARHRDKHTPAERSRQQRVHDLHVGAAVDPGQAHRP